MKKSLCFCVTENGMVEVIEKAGSRSGGLLKAKMEKKVTKNNSQLIIACKRQCISQLAKANKTFLICLISRCIPRADSTFSCLGLPGWRYIKYSWWFLYCKSPGLKCDLKGPKRDGLSPGSSPGSLFEHGQSSSSRCFQPQQP